MQKCECQYQKELAVITDTFDRWKPIIDGNGKEPIGIRLKIIEVNQERNNKTMNDLTETVSNLKTATSSFKKLIEFEQEAKENETKKKQTSFTQIATVIMISLTFAALLWNIVKDYF